MMYDYSTPFTGKWKPNDYPFVDNVRALYLTLEKLIQPEETQVNGIVILADYTGVGMSQASNPGPFLAKKVVSILQVRDLTSDDRNKSSDRNLTSYDLMTLKCILKMYN